MEVRAKIVGLIIIGFYPLWAEAQDIDFGDFETEVSQEDEAHDWQTSVFTMQLGGATEKVSKGKSRTLQYASFRPNITLEQGISQFVLRGKAVSERVEDGASRSLFYFNEAYFEDQLDVFSLTAGRFIHRQGNGSIVSLFPQFFSQNMSELFFVNRNESLEGLEGLSLKFAKANYFVQSTLALQAREHQIPEVGDRYALVPRSKREPSFEQGEFSIETGYKGDFLELNAILGEAHQRIAIYQARVLEGDFVHFYDRYKYIGFHGSYTVSKITFKIEKTYKENFAFQDPSYLADLTAFSSIADGESVGIEFIDNSIGVFSAEYLREQPRALSIDPNREYIGFSYWKSFTDIGADVYLFYLKDEAFLSLKRLDIDYSLSDSLGVHLSTAHLETKRSIPFDGLVSNVQRSDLYFSFQLSF